MLPDAFCFIPFPFVVIGYFYFFSFMGKRSHVAKADLKLWVCARCTRMTSDFFFPPTGSHHIALAGLKLNMYNRLASNSPRSTCLCYHALPFLCNSFLAKLPAAIHAGVCSLKCCGFGDSKHCNEAYLAFTQKQKTKPGATSRLRIF